MCLLVEVQAKLCVRLVTFVYRRVLRLLGAGRYGPTDLLATERRYNMVRMNPLQACRALLYQRFVIGGFEAFAALTDH
jgi:hypothetical protein